MFGLIPRNQQAHWERHHSTYGTITTGAHAGVYCPYLYYAARHRSFPSAAISPLGEIRACIQRLAQAKAGIAGFGLASRAQTGLVADVGDFDIEHLPPANSSPNQRGRPLGVPSPLPSDGRGEGQGEVRVQNNP